MADETNGPENIEKARITYAFWLAVSGFIITALLVIVLVQKGWQDSKDIVAVIGLFTSVLGTLVGAFFGLQIGAAGKEREQQERKDAQATTQKALSLLEPEKAKQVISNSN